MARGYSQKTPENVAHAKRMRADGKKLREIAEHFGCSVKTVHAWISDPDGAKTRARKDSYRGTCADCGEPTYGGNGPDHAPERCHGCSAAKRKRDGSDKVWTRGLILGVIQWWADEHGEPPGICDWNKNAAAQINDTSRATRAARLVGDGVVPHSHTVIREFGSWNAAIAAAGFTPRANHGGDGNALRRRVAA